MTATQRHNRLIVRVTTTVGQYKGWSVSVSVPIKTKIREFRAILEDQPYWLMISPNVRFCQRGIPSPLQDSDQVKPYMELYNYVPLTNSRKVKASQSASLKDFVTELPDPITFVNVKLLTTEEGYESWYLVIEMLASTTVRALKQLLQQSPHNLKIEDTQKVLFRLDESEKEFQYRNQLAAMRDEELVIPELYLLGYIPEGVVLKSGNAEEFDRSDEDLRYRHYVERHASLPPRERRAASWQSLLFFSFNALLKTGNLRNTDITADKPLVVWILGATESMEGFLFENNFFKEDDDHFVPLQIYMMGDDLREFDASAPIKDQKGSIQLKKFPYSNIAALEDARKPSLVVLFNVEFQNTRADGKAMQVPQRVLEAGKGALTVLSFRFRLWDASIKQLDKTLGQSLLFTPLRNPLSSMAGNPRMHYDDNGWIIGLRSLQSLPEVLALDLRPPFPEPCEPEKKLVAIFWGIIDLKYDADLPIFERIKVLESGDGRSSKFSHHGEEIPKRFRARHRLEDSAAVGRHTVVSNNKKLTHDEIVGAGYGHLVPTQTCVMREYDPGLADRIIHELDCKPGDIIVLKLCNRARAAGVIPVPTDELDEVLEELLQVPEDMEEWFRLRLQSRKQETLEVPWGSYEEQYRHWWCNECPFFVAERCCQSMPMPSDVDGKLYDGTLRVAFALRRTSNTRTVAHVQNGVEQNTHPSPEDQLEIEWLGGYWKLPKEDLDSTKLRERIISAARTKGTQAICPAHLHEIYAGLGYVVHSLFSLDKSEQTDWQKYDYNPAMAAYLTARHSVTLRDLSRCRQTMEFARTQLSKVEDGFPKRCIESYVHRGLGVFQAMQPPGCFWKEALVEFSQAVDVLPSNATALYLKGMALLELDRVAEAVDPMQRALLLDLDFKAPYVNLGVAWLRLRHWDEAIEISEALLLRYPDSPQCHYHIAVSCFMKSQEMHENADGDAANLSEDQAATYVALRERGQQAMTIARESEEGQRLQLKIPCVAPWLEEDDKIVNMLRPPFSLFAKRPALALASRTTSITLPPNVGWRFYGWRT